MSLYNPLIFLLITFQFLPSPQSRRPRFSTLCVAGGKWVSHAASSRARVARHSHTALLSPHGVVSWDSSVLCYVNLAGRDTAGKAPSNLFCLFVSFSDVLESVSSMGICPGQHLSRFSPNTAGKDQGCGC